MNSDDPAPAHEEVQDDEYAELVQVIVHRAWRPGDVVRTAAGTIWQFRPVPYTADFPEESERHGPARAARRDDAAARIAGQ